MIEINFKGIWWVRLGMKEKFIDSAEAVAIIAEKDEKIRVDSVPLIVKRKEIKEMILSG